MESKIMIKKPAENILYYEEKLEKIADNFEKFISENVRPTLSKFILINNTITIRHFDNLLNQAKEIDEDGELTARQKVLLRLKKLTDKCKTKYVEGVCEGSLTKKLDGSFAKFLLCQKWYGFQNKSEIDNIHNFNIGDEYEKKEKELQEARIRIEK